MDASTSEGIFPRSGASIPLKSMMHTVYSPYFQKNYKFTLGFKTFINSPIFVQFTLFWLNLRFQLPPIILTMSHLCITPYMYWTPLHATAPEMMIHKIEQFNRGIELTNYE